MWIPNDKSEQKTTPISDIFNTYFLRSILQENMIVLISIKKDISVFNTLHFIQLGITVY